MATLARGAGLGSPAEFGASRPTDGAAHETARNGFCRSDPADGAQADADTRISSDGTVGSAASLRLSDLAAQGAAPLLGAPESIPGGIARAAEPDLGDLRPRADNLFTGWTG